MRTMNPEAVAAIARKIDREWGSYGYFVNTMTRGGSLGSAVAEVWASDGAVFYVGSDRWGNTDWAETLEALAEKMSARLASV